MIKKQPATNLGYTRSEPKKTLEENRLYLIINPATSWTILHELVRGHEEEIDNHS